MFKKNLFENPNFDPDLYAKRLRSPVAQKRYVILFTARSGSSWLTDVISQTKKLGLPGEAFNPGFIPKMVQGLNVQTLDQHIEILLRRRARGGVHGFEITYHQLNAVFDSEDHFMQHFGDNKFIWLIRKNPVAQAVSLAKMVTTGVGHTAAFSDEEVDQADTSFQYDSSVIKKWLMHNRTAEIATEAMIERYDLKPLRICYESMTKVPQYQLLSVLARHIGTKQIPRDLIPTESEHSKLGTSRNMEMEEQFRAENAEFVAQIEEDRRPMLDQLTKLTKRYRKINEV
ncbi:Stf0 family sulfotransferase [Algirhabdus cladophorae]|uniref:Stf0 family sulfotransferase n=1 Tax=Algirhabdus cladophorae TaxID=3377108 RepID=UPI003B84B5A1